PELDDPGAVLRRSALAEIDPRTLYLLTKLRPDVFSLEPRATEPDLDGRDLGPTTILLRIGTPGPDAAAAGLGRERAPRARVRRLAVRATERGSGYGRRIMRAALALAAALHPRAEAHRDAQAHLEPWYASMGFETVSDVFLEAGIEHVAMMFRQPIRAEISSRSK